MVPEMILFSSAGALAVGAIALTFIVFQTWFFFKRPGYVWIGWTIGLSGSLFIFSLAVFVQFNTGAGFLNFFSELVQYSMIVFLFHTAYGFSFAYLKLKGTAYLRFLSGFHLLLLICLWSTDLIVARAFVERSFLWLSTPYVEPRLGPLGPVFLVYAATAAIMLMFIWGKHRDRPGAAVFMAGITFWVVLGVHDVLGTLGVRIGQFLTVYGFLGFLTAVVIVSMNTFIRLDDELAGEKERIDRTIESIGFGFITTDAEERILSFNKEAERLSGSLHGESIGRPLSQIYRTLDEKGNPRENLFSEVLKYGGSTHSYKNDLLLTRSGEHRKIVQTFSPVREKGGRIQGMVIVFRGMDM